MTADGYPVPLWRKAEDAWMRHVLRGGFTVVRLAGAEGNAHGTAAPLVTIRDRQLRAPDLLATSSLGVRYWEVKYRTRAAVAPDTGRLEFWVELDAFSDYLEISRNGTEVWIALYEATADEGPRWLQASVERLAEEGERATRSVDGADLQVWAWPVDAMGIVDGPSLDGEGLDGATDTFGGPEREPAVTSLRGDTGASAREESRGPATGEAAVSGDGRSSGSVEDAARLLEEHCAAMGLDQVPRYSVLCVRTASADVVRVLELLHFGIRVYLITDQSFESLAEAQRFEPFLQSRLLEWAVVPDVRGVSIFSVDGRPLGIEPATRQAFDLLLRAADATGAFNLQQYRIVHADAQEDILVEAGAGTGKTETMTERVVYLLATGAGERDGRTLGLDEVVLLTFSRQSAAEMRRRLARAMLLRRRLCGRCVLPVVEWLVRLAGSDIGTIHAYAKSVLAHDGASIGILPDFSVGEQTMAFRRIVREELSEGLERLHAAYPAPQDVPAAHEFTGFLAQLWGSLGQNGFSQLRIAGGAAPRVINWGPAPRDPRTAAIVDELRKAIGRVSTRFSDLCRNEQTIPLSELTSSATYALEHAGGVMKRPPRFVFIDEFQDTDAEQMRFLLLLRERAGARLFAVGDEKQGVYRFRGAQGNAFAALRAQTSHQPFAEYPLTRNYRSGRALLNSLHPLFQTWQAGGHLVYPSTARLQPCPGFAGTPIVRQTCVEANQSVTMVRTVTAWIADDDGATIGILCRENEDARFFRDALRKQRIPCELSTGGDFFRSPAVREARVLLEAVLDPSDDAAALELIATRWFEGLRGMEPPDGQSAEEAEIWERLAPGAMSWAERLAEMSGGRLPRADVESLQLRLGRLRAELRVRPALGWLTECAARLRPAQRVLADDTPVDLPRYARCFDHLVTLLDAEFADGPVSPHRILGWLRLQMATNDSEDEPAPPIDGGPARVIALTVHKAKGLEFDRVVIPRTTVPFRRRHIAVVPHGAGAHLIWRWSPKGVTQLQNVAVGSPLWSSERSEGIREEARLLYVALTRARAELVVLVPPGRRAAPPTKWSDLL